MINEELIQILIQGGNVGISLALIFLVWRIIDLLSNHLSSLEKAITRLIEKIEEWRKDLRR